MSSVDVQYPCPQEVDICVSRDADVTLTFVLTDARNHPVDITADTVDFTARDKWGGTAKIATISNISGHHIDPTNGKTAFTISQASINVVADSNRDDVWVYEVRRLAGGTSPVVIHVRGLMRIVPAVTAG